MIKGTCDLVSEISSTQIINLARLMLIGLAEGVVKFLSCHMTSRNLTIKETSVLPVGSLHSKLPNYHVWWLEILLK